MNRVEYLIQMSSVKLKKTILFYSLVVSLLAGFYSSSIIKFADSQGLLKQIDVDKDIFVVGFSIFVGFLSGFASVLIPLFIAYLSKSFIVMWLPNGKPLVPTYKTVATACIQEYSIIGLSILIFSFGPFSAGLIGGWFVVLNHFLIALGLLLFFTNVLKKLFGVNLIKSLIGFTIASTLTYIMFYAFASTR